MVYLSDLYFPSHRVTGAYLSTQPSRKFRRNFSHPLILGIGIQVMTRENESERESHCVALMIFKLQLSYFQMSRKRETSAELENRVEQPFVRRKRFWRQGHWFILPQILELEIFFCSSRLILMLHLYDLWNTIFSHLRMFCPGCSYRFVGFETKLTFLGFCHV